MATIQFYYRSKNDTGAITLRMSHKNIIDVFVNTQLYIKREEWTFDKAGAKMGTGMPNPKKGVDARNRKTGLTKLENHLLNRFEELLQEGFRFDKTWLNYEIDLYFKRITENKHSDCLLENLEHLIRTAYLKPNGKGGAGLSQGRIKHYKRLKGLLNEFCGRKLVKVKNVDAKFHSDFIEWMVNKHQYSLSYANKVFSNIKAVCNHAQKYGVEINPILNNLSAIDKTEKFIIYLTKQELKQIEETPMPNNYLSNTRKWLLLGCSIGQRGGDLLNITEKNFSLHKSGHKVIELTQQKTGKNVKIPVLPDTARIIQDGLPHKISQVKFNLYLKQLCEICGIDTPTKGIKNDPKKKRKIVGVYPKYELISSHVCRRTFCTNKYGELKISLIKAITGHSSENQLLKYIGKDGTDYVDEIFDFYAQQDVKTKSIPHLKKVDDISA